MGQLLGGVTIHQFLDTTVFVGFVFKHDNWNTASCVCLSGPDPKCTSSRVSAEFTNKVGAIRKEFSSDLLAVLDKLRRKNQCDFVSMTDLGWLVLICNRMRIWRFVNWLAGELKNENITFGELVSRLHTALSNYMAETFIQEGLMMKRINPQDILCWMRRQPYHSLQTQISSVVDNSSDVSILLDAHDLASSRSLSIEFVTGDKEHIKNNEATIIKCLRIARVRHLSEFLPS